MVPTADPKGRADPAVGMVMSLTSSSISWHHPHRQTIGPRHAHRQTWLNLVTTSQGDSQTSQTQLHPVTTSQADLGTHMGRRS